jgi:capsular polysaccharide export protein
MITIKSKGIRKIPYIDLLLDDSIDSKFSTKTTHYGVWGIGKETNKEAEKEAISKNIPLIRLEDGLIRSFSSKEPTYSLYKSNDGIYYDYTNNSNVEMLLNSNWQPTVEDISQYNLVLEMIKKYNISKYNEHPNIPINYFSKSKKNMLLVDQTFNDHSVLFGNANEKSFLNMINYALKHSNEYNIYVKIHPEVLSGKKIGYLFNIINSLSLEEQKFIHIISGNYNVPSCFEYIDQVLVVTSQVGFDALLRNKQVVCFGSPFYSNWGITTDMIKGKPRNKSRGIQDIFIAMMFYYTSYINPFTNKKGSLLDLVEYISLQKRHYNEKEVTFYKTKLWKRSILEKFLSTSKEHTNFVSTINDADRFKNLVSTWGYKSFSDIKNVKFKCCIEDGFIRSAGLGSNIEDPLSLVVDYSGIYFNPNTESDLEKILNYEQFPLYEIKQAQKVINELFNKKITKYNVGIEAKNLAQIKIKHPKEKIILAPGQVEDDASIILGTNEVNTNYKLLKAIAENNPNSVIIYKPHPDILVGNRQGDILEADFNNLKSSYPQVYFYTEKYANIIDCFNISDEVHVMTSTSGLEAILRNKKVVTYGLPFYGGYGLTIDMEVYPRPRRNLTKEELILGCYLLYPRYLLPSHNKFHNAIGAIDYLYNSKQKNKKTEKKLLNKLNRKLKLCIKTIQAIL